MDQIKTGRFIAETRKGLALTQRQLADMLSISDKTVSKWERGNGLPEVSLMLPLCDALNISVNDLLSGERLSESNYRKKAEENIMDLIKENAENRKRMTLSVICGSITIIAVVALGLLAAYVELPTLARAAIIVLAVATAVVGIAGACMLDVRAGYFECPDCKNTFVPTMSEYVKGHHTLTRRKLTCPKCGKSSMCKHRIVR